MIDNIVYFPFRLMWNLIIMAVMVGLFCIWWPFLFGSVLGVIIVLIFEPLLLIAPAAVCTFMVPIWD